jgi:hypothetical protein
MRKSLRSARTRSSTSSRATPQTEQPESLATGLLAVCTRWWNAQLPPAERVGTAEELAEAVALGVLPLHLLEQLTGEAPPHFLDPDAKQALSNLERFFQQVEALGITLDGLSAAQLASPDQRNLLPLTWGLVVYFERLEYERREELMGWVRHNAAEYPGVVLTDWETSFSDGLAWFAVLHCFDPTCVEYQGLWSARSTRLERVFHTAKQKFGVPRLLEVSDLDPPDARPVMLYTARRAPRLEPAPTLAQARLAAVWRCRSHRCSRRLVQAACRAATSRRAATGAAARECRPLGSRGARRDLMGAGVGRAGGVFEGARGGGAAGSPRRARPNTRGGRRVARAAATCAPA